MKTRLTFLVLFVISALCLIAQPTNDVPGTNAPSELDYPGLNLLPESLRKWVLIFLVLSPFVGRAIYAIKGGGGIKGIIQSIWLGTNTPKTPTDKPPGSGPTTLGLFLLIGALSFGTVGLTGCAWFAPSTVAEGSDPVVVGAEQTAKLSLAYTSEFLKWEWINRGTVGADVTKLADSTRGSFPLIYADLRAATKAYKTNRSPENRATLATVQATLDALIVRIQARIPADVKAKALADVKTIKLN